MDTCQELPRPFLKDNGPVHGTNNKCTLCVCDASIATCMILNQHDYYYMFSIETIIVPTHKRKKVIGMGGHKIRPLIEETGRPPPLPLPSLLSSCSISYTLFDLFLYNISYLQLCRSLNLLIKYKRNTSTIIIVVHYILLIPQVLGWDQLELRKCPYLLRRVQYWKKWKRKYLKWWMQRYVYNIGITIDNTAYYVHVCNHSFICIVYGIALYMNPQYFQYKRLDSEAYQNVQNWRTVNNFT